uniref:Uncharacterized protein n=1 Tax=Anguilla anguilla TaxID=7936 RepID=A0A0E9X3N2_ANGAN
MGISTKLSTTTSFLTCPIIHIQLQCQHIKKPFNLRFLTTTKKRIVWLTTLHSCHSFQIIARSNQSDVQRVVCFFCVKKGS